MLEGLGGTFTIHDVCGTCNQKFGDSIDRELLRNSPIVINRLLLPGAQTKKGHGEIPILIKTNDGLILDGVMRPGGPARLLPQVYEGEHGTLVMAHDNEDRLHSILRSRGVDWVVDNAKVKTFEGKLYGPTRLVLGGSDNKVILRLMAGSAGDADRFRCRLRSDLLRLLDAQPKKVSVGASSMVLTISSSVVDIPRCAAKISFNFLSYHLGPDFALRDDFDGVRGYVCGSNVEQPVEVTSVDGEVGLTLDERFVHGDWIRGGDRRLRLMKPGHYVILLAMNRHVCAMVALFGGAISFAVSLGRVGLDAFASKELPAMLYTPLGGGGDRLLSMSDLEEMMAGAHVGK